MNKLNELFTRACELSERGKKCPTDLAEMVLIRDEFWALKKRAEAAEQYAAEGWRTAHEVGAECDQLKAQLAEETHRANQNAGYLARMLEAEAQLAELAKQNHPKAVVKHYTGCKYPVIKINSLEVVIAGEREDAEELAEYVNSIRPAPAAVPDGWALVPTAPTWDMLSADGCKKHHNGQPCSHHDNRRRIWSAMLASAPDASEMLRQIEGLK